MAELFVLAPGSNTATLEYVVETVLGSTLIAKESQGAGAFFVFGGEGTFAFLTFGETPLFWTNFADQYEAP